MEVIQWVVEGKTPHMQELRGKVYFFGMNVAVLYYNKHTDPTKLYNALCICIPEANLKKCSNVA